MASPARAQEAAPPQEPAPQTAIRFLAGAAAAFGIHESAHVISALSFGARPGVKRIDYAGVPFFAIDHASVRPWKEFVISSSGFWVQHAGSEWILTSHPDLRWQRAPMLKGVLAFNLAASAVYSIAAFGELGPPERDTLGMAVSLGSDGVHESVIGALILAPAVLDGYRYLRPNAAWAKWTSRTVKVLAVVLVFAAGDANASR
jgi:hypothetical protein